MKSRKASIIILKCYDSLGGASKAKGAAKKYPRGINVLNEIYTHDICIKA